MSGAAGVRRCLGDREQAGICLPQPRADVPWSSAARVPACRAVRAVAQRVEAVSRAASVESSAVGAAAALGTAMKRARRVRAEAARACDVERVQPTQVQLERGGVLDKGGPARGGGGREHPLYRSAESASEAYECNGRRLTFAGLSRPNPTAVEPRCLPPLGFFQRRLVSSPGPRSDIVQFGLVWLQIRTATSRLAVESSPFSPSSLPSSSFSCRQSVLVFAPRNDSRLQRHAAVDG